MNIAYISRDVSSNKFLYSGSFSIENPLILPKNIYLELYIIDDTPSLIIDNNDDLYAWITSRERAVSWRTSDEVKMYLYKLYKMYDRMLMIDCSIHCDYKTIHDGTALHVYRLPRAQIS